MLSFPFGSCHLAVWSGRREKDPAQAVLASHVRGSYGGPHGLREFIGFRGV